jgi:uncharacterized SAM-binding protein YcdF (DUF218 family)
MCRPPDQRRVAQWSVRLFAAFGALAAAYLLITFVQVWRASSGDVPRSADVIVVLGAAQYDGRPSPVLQARLDRARELWEQGWAPVIITTGGKAVGDRTTEADAGYAYLREKGVPQNALVALPTGRTTWEEMTSVQTELAPAGTRRVLLVSNGYHSMRLDQIAGSVGLDATITPTSAGSTLRRLVLESGGVAVGRIVGYDRLSRLVG